MKMLHTSTKQKTQNELWEPLQFLNKYFKPNITIPLIIITGPENPDASLNLHHFMYTTCPCT